jgi:sulfate/thiosulfate transport system permease protein
MSRLDVPIETRRAARHAVRSVNASKAPAVRLRLERWMLIGVALVFLALFLVVPLAAVFAQAFDKGIAFFLESLADPDARAAIALTATVAAIAVPLNLVFGLAAWARAA